MKRSVTANGQSPGSLGQLSPLSQYDLETLLEIKNRDHLEIVEDVDTWKLNDFVRRDVIGRTLAPKYWYIKPANLWKWKLNALTVMMNGYSEKYEGPIMLGLEDPSENVRDFSLGICSKLGISY